jgi:hypothetical protein
VNDPILDALTRARIKLTELIDERGRIDKEILDWKRVVDSLVAVSNEHPDDASAEADFCSDPALFPHLRAKLTDAIRYVLQAANRPLSPPELRFHLLNDLGFDFSKYKQELVPIHNTLKRLERQGEVLPKKNEQGLTVGYQWISPIARALAEEMAHGPGAAMMAAFTANRPNRETATAALEAIEKNRKK